MKSYIQFLSRNKLYTCIEAFGMAFALGFVILLLSYAKTEYSVGKNIKDADNIYVLGTGDMFGLTLDTPVEFFHQFPEIDRWTRIANGMEEDVTVEDDYFKVKSVYIDSTFFQLFDYRLTGCPRERVLANEDEVIVSESFARKAFAGEEPVGKRVKAGEAYYTVCGVVEDFGRKDLFTNIDLFFSIKRAYNYYQRMDNFGNTLTFLTLQSGTDSEMLADKLLKKYVEYWPTFYAEDSSKGTMLWGSTLTRFDKAYFSTSKSYSIIKSGNRTLVDVLLLVAFVLLVSACFNYVNLTVALTGKRAKEMTMRRVLGEQTTGIRFRYFMEALLFTSGCFLLGILVAFLFHSLFEEWLATSIPLIPDGQMVVTGAGLLLLLALVSSILPSTLVLQFKPLDVVKGTFQLKNKMVFSRVFIIVQHIISITLMAVAITMTLQMHHLLTLPMGYDTEGLIDVESWDIGYTPERQEILRQRLLALPQVEAVGMAGSIPYGPSYNGLTDAEGNRSWICYSHMDTTTFRLLGFRVVEQFCAPTDSLCWIDRDTKVRYGITDAHPCIDGNAGGTTGKIVMRPRYKVCGIVENYRAGMANDAPKFEDGHNVIQLMGPNDWAWRQIVKVRGDRAEALAAIRKVCQETTRELTGYPKELHCTYLEDLLKDALSQERHTMQLVLCFMFISILISALGLFAMSINYCEQHSKEIALRKIMGASVGESAWKLSWPFIALSLAAVVVAIPLCVKVMRYYLQGFYYQIPFPWAVIPLSACLTMLVIVLSVLGQTLSIATRNPIEGIKTE